MRRSVVAVVMLGALAGAARADEGMWLINRPPGEALQERYSFAPDAAWLEHVQKSCISFGGGSGSFVSPNGLVLTNHHVGAGQIRKLSTAQRDLMKSGFYARTFAEELPCADLELRVLWSIEDVTEKLKKAVGDRKGAAAVEARKAEMSRLESESLAQTRLDSEVVTLYHGAWYHLYRYKRYTDVRLVFAPEFAIAFWGGDNANFEYPRFDFDVCLFRIYEDGKPLRNEHHLRWSANGASDGDLVFVAGHPWRTQRLLTYEHMCFLRDVEFPTIMREVWRRESIWQQFVNRSEEYARIASSELFGAANRRKASAGILAGLQDPSVMKAIKADEERVREFVKGDPQRAKEWGDAWEQVHGAIDAYRPMFERYFVMREGRPFRSELTRTALTLVRLAEELPKPSSERLREYRDSALDQVYFELYSPAPIYPELEVRKITSGLAYLAEQLGGGDPLVTALLVGRSPDERARELVAGTRLADVAVRRKLAAGGATVLAEADDPLLAFVRVLDQEERKLRQQYEERVQAVMEPAYTRIAAARFALDGERISPDATGSLRLSFGTISGYRENEQLIPPFTTFAGMYQLAEQRQDKPYDLPQRWTEGKSQLKLDTPVNFVCTADMIGGNSGSPVLNRAGEVVGLVFDGNIQSLVWNIRYTDEQGRSVSVDSRGIIEALQSVYDAGELVREITGTK